MNEEQVSGDALQTAEGMVPQPGEEYLTSREVAETLRVTLNTVGRWALRGGMPHTRTPGRRLRIPRSWVVLQIAGTLQGAGEPVGAASADQEDAAGSNAPAAGQ